MFKKRLSFLFCLVLFAAVSVTSVFAQDSEWYYDKPIKNIAFEGLVNVKNTDLEGITSSFIGKSFNDDVFADLLNRVYAVDYFEDISPQALPGDPSKSSVTILFQVIENPVIDKIIFSGNRQVRTPELKDKINIKEKDVFVKNKVLLEERAIRDLYLEKGFTNVKITSSEEIKNGLVEVTFHITEGKPTVITKIQFRGNLMVAEKTLKGKIKLKEIGFLNKGAFQESMLEQDKQIILTYYQDRGYVDVAITDVVIDRELNEEKQREEITITFILQEGSQYTFGGISFTGNRVFTTEQLDELVKLKAGSIFNQTKFSECLTAVTDLYYENGYTSNSFVPEVDKNTNTKTLTYKLTIHENPRSHIESIVIRGNTFTKEYVIRRELPMESGDIFSKAKLYNGLRNLYNLQYFSAVVPDFLPGSEENLINLVLNVEETSTRSVEFGLTFSGVTNPEQLPVSFYGKLRDSNLFGEGKSGSFGLTVSDSESSVEFSFGQNWLFGKPISTNFAVEYAFSKLYNLRDRILADGTLDDDYYYFGYEQHKFSLSYSMGKRWTPDFAIITTTAGISGSLVDNIYDPSQWTPVDTTINTYNNNWAPKNAIWTQLSLDGRDVNYDPSKGWFLSQRLSWYGLLPQGIFGTDWGETEFYLRTDTKSEIYFTLVNQPVTEKWDFNLVLMGYTSFTFQFPFFDSKIGDTNRLYIDGMFNGRGWRVYNSKHGLSMWSSSIELRMPIVKNIISLDLFFDAVQIKKELDGITKDFANMNDWYFSFGPGIRILIPQLPLKFMFSNTFKFDNDGKIKFRNNYDKYDLDWYKNWNFVLSFNYTNK